MSVGELRAPRCQFRVEKDDPPCNVGMFRIGTELQWAWVCPNCDAVDPSRALDLPKE